MKKLNLLIFCLCALMLVSCAHVVKEPVFIPVKCEISPPTRPTPTLNTAQNVKNILIYTQKLERDLHFCINGEVE